MPEPKRKQSPGPRTPSRGRGLRRHAALLDATEILLASHGPEEIGLYQIAEQANVPPPSVYHFFPSKEAAFEALARRLTTQLLEVHHRPIDARRITNWPDLFRIDIDRARAFYNSSPPALKIFYGGSGGVDAQAIDRITADAITANSYDRLNMIFHVPYLSDRQRMFQIRLAILDAIWTMSVRSHGRIADEEHEEAFRACIAYSRLSLPDYLEPRPLLTEAARRGQQLLLPFDGEFQVIGT